MTQIFNNSNNKKKEANNSLLLLPSAAIFLFISGAWQACRGGTIRKLRVKRGEWLKTQWGPDNVTAGTNGRKYTQNQIWLSAVSQGHGKWCVSGELWRCSRFTAQPITHFLNMQGPLPPPPPPVKRGAGVLLPVSSPLQCSVEGLKKINK